MNEAAIRPATIVDLEELTRMYKELIQHQAALDDFAAVNPDYDVCAFVRESLRQGFNHFFLAEREGKPQGFVRLAVYYGAQAVPLGASQEPLLHKLTLRRISARMLLMLSRKLPRGGVVQPRNLPFRYGYLADIYVQEDCRGQGVGKMLVQRAMQWFRENDVNLVFLNVLENNEVGKTFWAKMGFRPNQISMVKKI